MMKNILTEESIEKVTITSVRLQRIVLICQKDTAAINTEKTVVIYDSCQTAIRKDACKRVHVMHCMTLFFPSKQVIYLLNRYSDMTYFLFRFWARADGAYINKLKSCWNKIHAC